MFYKVLTSKSLIKYRLGIILFVQFCIVTLSYYASFLIRFEFDIPSVYLQVFYKTLPIIVLCRMSVYFLYKLHLASWRFVSVNDLMDTLKAVIIGSVIFIITTVFIHGLVEFPRSVFILDAILNITIIGGSRFMIRYFQEITERGKPKVNKFALIAGAGKAGVLVLNEVRNNPEIGIHVVGFVDDDSSLKGIYIQGISVMGSTEDIPHLVKKHNVDEVIIAIPSARFKDISRIMDIVNHAQIKARVLPRMGKVIKEDHVNGFLKDVSYDELLGRKTIKFSRESDNKLMRTEIKDNIVLVTGAGGSIGSELCRQISNLRPRALILYERYENNLYDLELELKNKFPDLMMLPIIGDIQDYAKFSKVLQKNKVNLIYHAAAFKHVPIMEREPMEAVRNNVFGTFNVAKLAIENHVNKLVLISTDKAVNPVNVMGTTKRICELIIQGLNTHDTKFVAVRFGNVIGSNGSVIPLFKKQIAAGGPITVTHRDITRYFMSIPEAVQLVMTAGSMGKGGEIFLLDMGEPVKIVDIARELIKRSGLDPDIDIDIVYTGLRPGEKLHEELYWKGEGIIKTENKKITMLKPNGIDYSELIAKIDELQKLMISDDVNGVMKLMKNLVPEAKINFYE